MMTETEVTPLRGLRENVKLPAKFDDMATFPTPRKRPFTQRERDVLLTILKKYADIIENKRTDSITVLQKKRTWTRITNEYNNSSYVKHPSTAKQLEKAWKNLKAKERNFQLADFYPKIPVVLEPDPPPVEDSLLGPSFMLLSGSDRFRASTGDFSNTWSYGKSSTGYIKEEDPDEPEAMYEDGVLRGRTYLPERCQQQPEVFQPTSRFRQTQGGLEGIKISSAQGGLEGIKISTGPLEKIKIPGVHSQASEKYSEKSTPFVPKNDSCDSNSLRTSSRSVSPDITEDEKQLCREEQLHDLRIQLASAQLAKIKTETELQTLLLNEQLRKAKAEADLAELMLEKNRARL